jgi:hypothetical protein
VASKAPGDAGALDVEAPGVEDISDGFGNE